MSESTSAPLDAPRTTRDTKQTPPHRPLKSDLDDSYSAKRHDKKAEATTMENMIKIIPKQYRPHIDLINSFLDAADLPDSAAGIVAAHEKIQALVKSSKPPASADIYYSVGKILLIIARDHELDHEHFLHLSGKQWLLEAVKLTPQWEKLGDAMFEVQLYKDARKFYFLAVEELESTSSKLRSTQGYTPPTQKYLNELANLNKKLGMTVAYLGEIPTALYYFRQAIDHAPHQFDFMSTLAITMVQNFDEQDLLNFAENNCAAAYFQNPGNKKLKNNYALVCCEIAKINLLQAPTQPSKTWRKKFIISWFEEATTHNPHLIEAWDGLINFALAENNISLAKKYLLDYMEKNLSSPNKKVLEKWNKSIAMTHMNLSQHLSSSARTSHSDKSTETTDQKSSATLAPHSAYFSPAPAALTAQAVTRGQPLELETTEQTPKGGCCVIS